jgi:hypothetical protein
VQKRCILYRTYRTVLLIRNSPASPQHTFPRAAELESSSSAASVFEVANADKPINAEKCQAIDINTLNVLHKTTISSSPLTAQSYLRELFQTQRCDTFKNLAPVRT